MLICKCHVGVIREHSLYKYKIWSIIKLIKSTTKKVKINIWGEIFVEIIIPIYWWNNNFLLIKSHMFSQILNPSCSIRPMSLNNLNYVSVYLWIGWWKILFTVVIQDIDQCLYVQHIYFHEINKVGHISVFYKLILSLSITFIRYHARTWRYRHNRGKMFWLKVEGISEMRKPCLSCPETV